jgi:cytochrome c556
MMVPTAGVAQDEIYEKRKAYMNDLYDSQKAIKSAVAAKDYATVEAKAKDIAGKMDRLLDQFPKGSAGGKSKAKPEIWDNLDNFSKIAVKVKEISGSLAKAAAARDEAKVEAQFNALGAESPFRSGACAECHREYRISPPRKGTSG